MIKSHNFTKILIMPSRLILSLILIFAFQFSFAQSQKATAEKLEKLLTHLHNNGQFNGTVLIAENGAVIHKGAYGYADYEAKRKLEVASPFYLASVSKQFTTMGVMILKEKGKLSYDDPVTKYFPKFPAYAKSVTIRQMMQHTSGIANHYALGIYKPGLTNDDVYQTLLKQKALDFTPGERYNYSNGAYVMLAMIIEKVSGQPLNKFMKEHIFEPLGMDNTLVYVKDTPSIQKRAIGYTPAWTLEDYTIFTTGAGGLYSTVEDLLKWDQALYANKLVSAETLEEAYTPATLNDGSKSDYGFGWGIAENESGGKVVQHSGGLNGFRTFLERDLENKRTIILLTNNGSTYLPQVTQAIRNVLQDKAYELPKISIGQKVHRLIEEIGLEKALAEFEALKSSNDEQYKFSESELNDIGYYYLNNKKDPETAIAIFKANVKAYPEGANGYDSLAEAYMVKGENEKSIKNYEKSLELNPGNTNAITMLQSMGEDVSKFQKEVKIPEAVLETYVGKYQLNPSFAINVTKDGSQMKAQATNQPVFDIFAQSQNKFYLKVVAAQVQFNKSDTGQIESLTLFQNGQEMIFKRVE